MKKSKALKVIILAFCLIILSVSMVACGEKSFTVTFMDGDTVVTTLTVEENKEFTLPTNPDKEGYSFVGWYTDAELTNPYAIDAVTTNFTLYAKYNKQELFISVNSKEGSKVSPLKVSYGQEYSLEVPTREGYDFVGYTYDNGTEDVEFPLKGTYNFKNSIRVSANWKIKEITVNFYDGVTLSGTKVVKYGETVTPLVVSKKGYTFVNWYVDEELTNAFDKETEIKDSINLYAKFNANSYKIVFDTDGGNTIDNASIVYNAQFSLPTPTKTGYDFLGWYNVMDDNKVEDGTYEWLTDVRLKAKWAIKKNMVTFKCGNATETEEVEYGKCFAKELSDFTVENGYEAVGFYTTETFDGEAINVASYQVTAPIVLYVKVAPKTFHITVTGYANDGYNVVYNTTYELEAAPTSEGEIFQGYFLNNEAFAVSGTYTYTDNIIVEARFQADPEYNKVHVKLYDENNKLIKDKTIDKNTTVDLSDIDTNKTGYTFTGWFKEDGNEFDTTTALSETISLYVKYEANKYTITIDKDNGETSTTIDVVYNETYTLPELTKEGYTFDCYRINDTTEQKIAASGTYTFTDNISIKAYWIIKTYKVEFIVGAEVYAERTVNHGSQVVLPNAPSRDGYTFTCWLYNNAQFDTQKSIVEDTTLNASFTANEYSITVVCYDGTKRVVKATYGETYTIPDPENVVNHKFNGYVLQDDNTKVIAAEGEYTWTENITIKESWEKATLDDSTETFVDNGSYFKERTSVDEEFTYVFVTGGEYNLSKELVLDEAGKSLVTLNSEGKGFTVGNTTGEFTLTIKDSDVTYERHIKIVKQITAISYGDDYNDYVNNTHLSAFVNQTKETMTAGIDNLKVDIKFTDEDGQTISYADANAVVAIDTTDTFSVDENGSITFNKTALDKDITITIKAKYDTRDNATSLSYVYKLNEGKNVYTSSELYYAYGDSSIHEINILRNIEASITDSSVQCGTDGKIINKTGYGIYVRNTFAADKDTMTINGNYFLVDGTNLDRVGSIDTNVDDTGYIVASVHASMFEYGTYTEYTEINGDKFSETYRSHDGQLTINNLRLQSNMDYNRRNETISSVTDTNKQQLVMSDTYIGIYTNGGTTVLNNVSITNTLIAVYCDGGVSATDTTKTATDCTLNNCKIDKNWANGMYFFNVTSVTLNHSEIGESCGAAIHFDDKYQTTSVNNSLTMDSYSATNIQNWVSGNEAWFVAYGQASTATALKTQVESGANQFGMTILKTATDGETQLLNFAILIKSGTGETGDWNADPNGGPTLFINGTELTQTSSQSTLCTVSDTTSTDTFIGFGFVSGSGASKMCGVIPMYSKSST